MGYTILMKLRYGGAVVLFFLPLIAAAQTFQVFLVNLATFMNNIVIPFLIGTAFFIFAYNAIRFFVIGGSNKEGQEKAKSLALYGVAAFVVIIVFWGIINMLTSSIGLDGCAQPGSDYVDRKFIGPKLPLCP